MTANRIAAGVFTLLGLFAVMQSLQLPYYTPNGPGPGFFPLWIGIALAGVSAAYLIQCLVPRASAAQSTTDRGPDAAEPVAHGSSATVAAQDDPVEPNWPGKAGALRVGIVLAAVLYVAITIQWLGFALSMFTMLTVVLRTLGRQKLWVTGVLAVIGSIGVYYVFVHWLRVQLPPSTIPWLAMLGL